MINPPNTKNNLEGEGLIFQEADCTKSLGTLITNKNLKK